MAQDVKDQQQPPREAPDASGARLAGQQADTVDTDESVDHPTRLLRIASMARTMLDEVRRTDLDRAARERLASIHNTSVAALRELVSDDLRDELDDVGLLEIGEGSPSEPELRIAQAQLVGWLEGLFHGIQASIATQQMAAQKQLEQVRRRRALGQGDANGSTPSGQYL